MKLDILGALIWDINNNYVILFVNLFDTTGTLLCCYKSKLNSNDEKSNGLNKALKADSSASIFGTFLVALQLQVM